MVRFQEMEINSVQSPVPSCLPQPPSVLSPEFSFWNKHPVTIQYIKFKLLNTAEGVAHHMVPNCVPGSLWHPTQASYLQAVDSLESMEKCSRACVLWIPQNVLFTHDKSVQTKLKCQVLSFWLELYQLGNFHVNQKLWLAVAVMCQVVTAPALTRLVHSQPWPQRGGTAEIRSSVKRNTQLTGEIINVARKVPYPYSGPWEKSLSNRSSFSPNPDEASKPLQVFQGGVTRVGMQNVNYLIPRLLNLAVYQHHNCYRNLHFYYFYGYPIILNWLKSGSMLRKENS